MRTVGLLLWLGVAASLHAADAQVLYSAGGVTVSAEQIRDLEDRYADYRVTVKKAGRCYFFASSYVGDRGRRWHDLAAVEAVKDYLLVPASCGGGNASKCRGFQAFNARQGLKYLGNLTGYWDGSKAVVYDGTWFYDTGDQLEINDLLNHAESPRYTVAYLEKSGLIFDPGKTWELNAGQYADARDDAAGLLFKAGLAKLCGKMNELAALEAAAKKALPAPAWPRFKKSLIKVRAGASKPNPFLPVMACKDVK